MLTGAGVAPGLNFAPLVRRLRAASCIRGATPVTPRRAGLSPPRNLAESVEESYVLYVPLARAAAARSPGHLHSGGPGARNRAGDHRDRGVRRGQERPVHGPALAVRRR